MNTNCLDNGTESKPALIECKSCGTLYASTVLEKLRISSAQLARNNAGDVCRYLTRDCLCGGKIVTRALEADGLVLVTHRNKGAWQNSSTYAVKPLRVTKTRIYFVAPWGGGEGELAYKLSDRSEHGGCGEIKESELAIALKMLEGK